MMLMKCHELCKPVCILIVVNIALAFVNLFLKMVLNEGMDYMSIVTYRQAISFIFMAPIAWFYERKHKLEAHIICLLFLSALVGVTLPQYLFLLGLENTSATFSCAFLNMVPVFTFIMSLPFGIEKVNMKSKSGKTKVLGTIVCIGGVLLLALYKGISFNNPQSQHIANRYTSAPPPAAKLEKWIIGSILLTAGCILWSSWFIIQAKISKKYPCQYSSTAILSLFAAIQSTTATFAIKRNNASWIIKGKLEIMCILYTYCRICLGYCWHVYSFMGKKYGKRAMCLEGYTSKSRCRMSMTIQPITANMNECLMYCVLCNAGESQDYSVRYKKLL
ncbi:WAT1-related protein At3g30340-like isoform X2 [Cicer arietinum]|uniref:WAT1-related protein At3g30340-like isoform X2 n=1 Tax=Cicer arietinum TaxID=3827 RepID=UPI003CC6CB43